ncbi:hypothetical protein K8T06_07915 [bacterium]|nr:hypothetical protein [bacterium]
MENMPLMVLFGVGCLLVIVVVLFIVSQKRQDKKDSDETKNLLDNLEINLKSASEDIDDTAAALEAEDNTGKIKPADHQPKKKPDKKPDKKSVDKKPADKMKEPLESSSEKTENIPEKQDKETDMAFGDYHMISDDDEPDDSVSAPAPVVPSTEALDVPDAEDSSDNIIFDSGDDDMSELDALFEASSSVEELVMSGTNEETDILEDLQDDDFFSGASTTDPMALESKQDSDPIIAIEPKPEPEPVAPAPPDPDEAKRHEKAKRIARVIVNDIRNYNTDKLAEGIRMGNIMKTLGKEVERGRLLYIKRIPPEITRETNYYREALIKILADGRLDLLGL